MTKGKPNAGTTGKLTGWRCSGFFSHEGFGGSGFIQIGIAIGIGTLIFQTTKGQVFRRLYLFQDIPQKHLFSITLALLRFAR
jgi:hypothetical protein